MRKLLRNGAGILLLLSCNVFVGLLAYQFLLLEQLQGQSQAGGYTEHLPAAWISIIGAVSSSLSGAAIPFLGACVIDRVDRFLAHKEAAE